MYRAATWWAMHNNTDLDDPKALVRITAQMPLEMSEEDGALQVRVGGQDVTRAIRTPEITRQIYKLDHVPGVRALLVDLQRTFGARQPTVAEGRDMGTVVFPDASVKIFLDASAEVRANRRYNQLIEKGLGANLPALVEEIRARDDRDRNRSVAPLKPAEDALLLDSSEMGIDEVEREVFAHLSRVLGNA